MEKAIVYARNAPLGVALKQIEKSTLSARDTSNVVVKVHYAGLNPVDAKNLLGDKLPEALGKSSFPKYLIEGRPIGFDFAGKITESNNKDFKVGDRVFGGIVSGSLQTTLKVAADQICHLPDSITYEQASGLPLVCITILKAFHNIKDSGHVLIIGASGGVGHVAVQIAKFRFFKVSAVCSARNAEFVQSLGADTIIDYNSPDLLQNLKSVSETEKFALVFDCVSSNDSADAGFKYQSLIMDNSLLASDGIYKRIGGQLTEWTIAFVKMFMGVNLFPRNFELVWVEIPKCRPYLEKVVGMNLRLSVAKVHEFSEQGVKDAFDALLSRRSVGKHLVKIE